jgi:predicted lipid-binding transport protein (Tim44 family)
MEYLMVQVLILAAVAAFLFWRLSIVLGIRTGFEKTLDKKVQDLVKVNNTNVKKENTENQSNDDDISDYVELDSDSGSQLKIIKEHETSFSVQSFVSGAKNAYELILMAYENGDLDILETYLSKAVYKAFEATVNDRISKGFRVEATFLGLREIRIRNVIFDEKSSNAEITVFFKCELSSVVRDSHENIVEGSNSKVKVHTDVWTFGRIIGSNDPAWKLIATNS